MKRAVILGIMLSSLLFILGMGGGGGSSSLEKIPVPEKNFASTVIDKEKVQTSLSQSSLDGRVFITGKRGDAKVAVPFEKIAEVQFQSQGGNEILAKITLRDQQGVELKVDKGSVFYGKAEFGTFQIEVKALQSIKFRH